MKWFILEITMALTADLNWIWKWLICDWSVLFDIYWKMFEPNVPELPDGWSQVSVHNPTTNFDLSWFQQWNEVCLSVIEVSNHTSDYYLWDIYCHFQQWNWSGRDTTVDMWLWYADLPPEEDWTYRSRCAYAWMWVDPDEFRPWITQYRFRWEICGEDFYKTCTCSNLSIDTDPHPAGYMWVEWSNLCYVPPCYYSGSSQTWYKHMIQPDPWYSWSSWQTPWHIWIPSSSSDHHIYYVNEYGIVSRTKESYAWSGGSSSAWSNTEGFIWLIPSTSSTPEQAWYNYLCYVDWGWYKRRMWVWEI